jgi:hypothetical protein
VPSPPSRAGKGHAHTRDKRSAKRKGDERGKVEAPESESRNSAYLSTSMPGEGRETVYLRAAGRRGKRHLELSRSRLTGLSIRNPCNVNPHPRIRPRPSIPQGALRGRFVRFKAICGSATVPRRTCRAKARPGWESLPSLPLALGMYWRVVAAFAVVCASGTYPELSRLPRRRPRASADPGLSTAVSAAGVLNR